MYINNGSSEKVEYHLSADDGQLNQNKFGTISIDQDLALWTTVGGEYVFGNFVQPSTDASLAAIYVNGKKLANFSAEKYSYSYYVTGTSIPTITVETIDENAKAEISMPSTLPGTVTIIVTAQDGTRKEYTVSLLKQEESTTTPPVIQPTPDYHPNGTGNNGIFNPGINQPTTNNENTARFSDIIGHWAEKDIEEMAKKGIVSGVTDTTFEPDRAITRAEFAALIVRALNISVKGSFVFQDVQPTSWYADAVAAAEAADLMVGSEGYFRPEENITREEMAVVIVKAYQMLGKTVQKGSLDKFKDQGDISKWAKDSVAYAVGVNLISGMTADIFAPQENATRAQVTSLIKRLLIQ